MKSRIQFLLNRLGERLWVKPLAMCVVSVGGALLARAADHSGLGELVPDVTADSVHGLLNTLSASMLVIATFAVASMVSAYASASSTATPRSFPLIIADDVSQNALSAFLGAFIFSIVSLVALDNSYYDRAGRFALFLLTILVFAIVVGTFVRWVDSVARLGRLGTTIAKVEAATVAALGQRRRAPHLGGIAVGPRRDGSRPVFENTVGYVLRVDVNQLQTWAEESGTRVEVAALPGTFAAPGRALAYVSADSGGSSEVETDGVAEAFVIGKGRTFDEDPRFGLIVLSEIASRALSPGINDPGTAIDVIGTLVRILAGWSRPLADGEAQEAPCDRVAVPALELGDMLEDAFGAIARDGAGTIEVVVRLQKALESLASIADGEMRAAAVRQARRALARAEMALELADDLAAARAAARFAGAVAG